MRALIPRSVTLVVPFEIFGAAEDYAVILAEGLLDRGWEVTVLCSKAMALRTQVRNLQVKRARICAVTTDGLNGIRELAVCLREFKPDIVHVNQEYLPGLAAARCARVSGLVVTIHTPAHEPSYSHKGRVLRLFTSGGVDRWIVLSERNAALLRSRWPSRGDRIRVVAPGLPMPRFGHTTRDEARARLGIAADAVVIGTVCRLEPEKRVDVLLEAAAQVAGNVQVLVVGEGTLLSALREQADLHLPGRVRFLGYRADVPEILSAFDIFCLSSDFEGLPFALLEAMATGLPVVASDVQGSGEAIVSGESGLLVPPRSPRAMAEAITWLLTHPRDAHRLGAAARNRFQCLFTAEVMLDSTEAVYRELLGTQHGRTVASTISGGVLS